MAVPIKANGTIVGAVSVGRFVGEPAYTDADLSSLVAFGDVLAIVDGLERDRAAHATAETELRNRLGHRLFEVVASDLLQTSTGIYGVLTSMNERDRERLSPHFRSIDQAVTNLRSIVFETTSSGPSRTSNVASNTENGDHTDPMLSDLIAMIGHDARAPLGAVLGYLEILSEDQQLAATSTDLVSRAQGAAQRTNSLLNEIPELILARNGQIGATKEPLNMVRVLPEILGTIVGGNTVVVTMDDSPRPFAFDRSQLTQILTNLIGNAFRHGASPVTIRVEDLEHALHMTVSDAGPGVPAEQVRSLFLLASMTGVMTNRESGGLGLAIARSIAESHGGTLTLEEHTSGCIFRLTSRASAP